MDAADEGRAKCVIVEAKPGARVVISRYVYTFVAGNFFGALSVEEEWPAVEKLVESGVRHLVVLVANEFIEEDSFLTFVFHVLVVIDRGHSEEHRYARLEFCFFHPGIVGLTNVTRAIKNGDSDVSRASGLEALEVDGAL